MKKKNEPLKVSFTSKSGAQFGYIGNRMFYIGVGSGRVFTAPINDDIVKKVKKIDKLPWREVVAVSDYFMIK